MKRIILILTIALMAITAHSQASKAAWQPLADTVRARDSIARVEAMRQPLLSMNQLNATVDAVGQDLADKLSKLQWELVIAVLNRRLQEQVNLAAQKKN